MAVTFEGVNYSADENRPGGWLGEDSAVVDWPVADVMIVALRIGSTTHNGDTVTPECIFTGFDVKTSKFAGKKGRCPRCKKRTQIPVE